MASSETEPPPAQPNADARRRSALFIGAFVLLQFVLPLSYLAREDSSDQRFTWRGFIEADAPLCETRVSLERPDGQREDIQLDKTVHPDWAEYLRQGRRAVVDAFMQKQCESGEVLQVELVNDCDALGTHEYRLRCGSGRAHQTVRTAAR